MKGDIVRRADIDAAMRSDMYTLFAGQFGGVSREEFLRDLDEKNWVLLLRGDGGELAGFSSLHVYRAVVGEQELTVVYSGDTVVDVSTWSDSALSYYWMGAVDYLQRYYETDRAIRTASSEQVRQPIYKGALGRWRFYEKNLDFWIEELAPIVEELPETVRNAGL